MPDFTSLQLQPFLLRSLEHIGYQKPTPIQAQSIPHLLNGKDLLGIAQTGTGKTAAFSLPIINRIGGERVKVRPGRVRVLILTPTRELASQIDQNISDYSKGIKLHHSVMFGGVGYRTQIMAMSKGVDILIATPGRLLELMDEGHVQFDQLDTFVLDEADRMLDMGFLRDIKKVVAKLPKKRQTIFFSATMPDNIAELANSLLHEPVRVEVTPQATTVEKIDQTVQFVDKANKGNLLKSILKDHSIKCALVFTKTKHGANRVAEHLEKASISSAAIHGNKSQGARERALDSFRSGKIRVLVATDIAARGIDVSQVSHVINYDIPNDPKSYVHRIGRTARAGKDGVAISFCDPSEMKLLKEVEKLIKQKIEVTSEHTFVAEKKSSAIKRKPAAQKNKRRRNHKKSVS